MAGKIKIDVERCKGCGLCIGVCPKKNLDFAKETNKKGLSVVKQITGECSGCTLCAIICPEAVIEVYRDEPPKNSKTTPKTDLVEEKR